MQHAFSISTMPFYVHSMGGGAATVGLVISTWAGGNILASLWMGVASDRYGRKPVMIGSLISSMVGFLFTALAYNLPTLLAARLFLGITSGSLPVAQSYIADIVEPRERAQRLASLGALNALAVMLGPPLGSLIASTPLGLSGPFLVGAVMAAGGVLLALHSLMSKEELETLRKTSPAARAQSHWQKLREEFTPSLSSPAGRVTNDERWPTITITAIIAGGAAMLNATPAVVLALGPMKSVGLGQGAFGVALMWMGVCGIVVQLGVFKRLVTSWKLYRIGAMGATCSSLAPLAFLLIGRRPCAPSPVSPPDRIAISAEVASLCVYARASAADLLLLMAGSALFAAGYILCNACISPILVQSATSKSTGRIVGLGATGAAVGRALGPATWGLILRVSNVPTAFVSACAIATMIAAAWLVAEAIDAAEDERRTLIGLARGRTVFLRVVLAAAAKQREATRQEVLHALHEQLDAILHRRGYNLCAPGAIEKVSAALDYGLDPHGRSKRIDLSPLLPSRLGANADLSTLNGNDSSPVPAGPTDQAAKRADGYMALEEA